MHVILSRLRTFLGRFRWLPCVASLLALTLVPGISASGQNGFKVDKSADCGVTVDPAIAVCRGGWSSKTVALFNTWNSSDINPHRRLSLPSPDGKKTILVDGFRVRLRMDGKTYWTPFGMMHDAEVGWAPDSARLFVTWTESGELGPWQVQADDVTEDGLREIKEVTRDASRDLLRRERKAPIPKDLAQHRGYWNALEYCAPEIVGSQWLNGSSEILISALAGPDSGCKYMGDFRVYRMEAKTGRILESYSATEAHRLFGDDDLPKILDANDDL
jgi:hypothetical protein